MCKKPRLHRDGHLGHSESSYACRITPRAGSMSLRSGSISLYGAEQLGP